MEIKPAALGAIAVIGLAAAGGGAYLAVLHNGSDSAQPVPMYAASTGNAVTETENSITSAPVAAVQPAPQAAVAEPKPQPVVAEPAPAPAPVRTARRAPAPSRAPSSAPSQRTRTSPSYGGNSPSAPVYTPPSAPVDSPVSPA